MKCAQPVVDDEILLPALPSEVCGLGRLKRIITKFPSEPLEVMGALSMITIGIWFLIPTVHFPTAGVVSAASNDNSRWWGAAILAIGVFKWWATLWHYENRLYRLIAAALATTAYSLILSAYIRYAPTHVMTVIMGLWIGHQCWIAYRSQRLWHSHK